MSESDPMPDGQALCQLVAASPFAVALLDGEGNLRWWNGAAEELFGWRANEVTGRRLADLLAPDDAPHGNGWLEILASVPAAGKTPPSFDVLRPDGRSVLVEVTLSEITSDAGSGYGAFILDITESESARLALESSEQQFRSSFIHAPIGKLLTDVRPSHFGRLLAANPAAQAMLGYTEAELSSMAFGDITHPDDIAHDRVMVERLLAGQLDKLQYEKRYLRSDGTTVWASLSATLVRAKDGSPLHAVAQLVDITSHRAQAAELERLNQELTKANADLTALNTELDSFTATVAHDLKNPLSAITGFSELLADIAEDPSEAQASAVAAILRGTGRMQRLVDELLAYSRATHASMHLETVSLEALVDDIMWEVTHSSRGRCVITRDELPAITLEPTLFRQVLDNVIGNAIKYVAPGTVPHVHVSAEEDPDAQRCTLRVADNGIGIAASAREDVFTMFHRESPTAYAGTGIGLAISRRVVHRHGGRIWMEPNQGGGTVVNIELPHPAGDGPAG